MNRGSSGNHKSPEDRASSGLSALSSRELEIASAYCEGATYRDVADALSIAPTTVRTHLQTIYQKLGVSSKIQLVRVLNAGHAAHGSNGGDEPLPLPDKPSIAVLPFDNLNGDPEQDFLADGIVEDVITALSRFGSLFVIARNSSFVYKGETVGIAQIGRELGVRYVVEGSVRKAGDQLRITAQLIDASSGNHLWADRFDGSLHDVFDLQDQITEQIVVAVEPEIGVRERQLARRKSPGNLGAWELLQRGLSHFYRAAANDRSEAMRLFREMEHVRVIDWESADVQSLELFTDGYFAPGASPSVAAWEETFREIERVDPEKISLYPSVKGSAPGRYADDRTLLVVRRF